YICEQGLKLEFDLDTKMLSRVLGAISETKVNPILSINFSIKESNAVGIELLERATVNARQKAEILAKASGVTLGKILTIDYNWSELLFSSVTRFELQNQAMPSASRFAPDIEPEDIESSDTVTFVWEII
ncbi:MAG: SIMPL domain-containing protein, partial [Erysipelothrix sp.]|nr:SIMPL domain-containing protein [Erysipelothrix sp.]